jgi:hypothetical protein
MATPLEKKRAIYFMDQIKNYYSMVENLESNLQNLRTRYDSIMNNSDPEISRSGWLDILGESANLVFSGNICFWPELEYVVSGWTQDNSYNSVSTLLVGVI